MTNGARQGHVEAALQALDPQELVHLLREMVGTPSPTGHEKALAEWLAGYLRDRGLEAWPQRVSGEQYNVIARLRGRGGGASLLFNGHLDTSYSGSEPHLHGIGYKPALVERGEWLYGLGIYNMKSGLAAAIAAVLAIQRAEVPIKGDIIIGGSSGEIEKAPVEEFQGSEYEGYGSGAAYMVKHGVAADVAVVCEPTDFRIATGHFGAVWVRLTLRGALMHTVYTTREGFVHAIEVLPRVLEGIRAWKVEFQKRHPYRGEIPAVNIGAVRGGFPWRIARTPPECKLYIDVRTVPGVRPVDVVRDLEAVMRRVEADQPGLSWSVDTYLTVPPYELRDESSIVGLLKEAHARVFGHPTTTIFRPPMDDSGHLYAAGIPAVSYGLGPLRNLNRPEPGHEPGERVRLADVVNLAKVYVTLAIDVVGRDPEELRGDGGR